MISVPLQGAEVRHLENPTTGDQLSVIAARGMVFSCWRPSPEEKAMLMADKPVWTIMRGNLIPEFILSVGDRNQVVPPEIIRRAQYNGELLNTTYGQQIVKRHKWKERFIEALAWVYLALLVAAGAFILWFGALPLASAIIGWVMREPLH